MAILLYSFNLLRLVVVKRMVLQDWKTNRNGKNFSNFNISKSLYWIQ